MRLIKALLVGATGLFVIITLFSLIIPSRSRVSRGITINVGDSAMVYQLVRDFGNWRKWHPVFTSDSASLSCHGGDSSAADSACIIRHHGRDIRITHLTSNSGSARFLLQASGENDIENEIIVVQAGAGAVQVEWRSIAHLRWYPWEKFYGIFMDKLTGPNYEAALNGLKLYVETNIPNKAG
jgi:hypothetical protein